MEKLEALASVVRVSDLSETRRRSTNHSEQLSDRVVRILGQVGIRPLRYNHP